MVHNRYRIERVLGEGGFGVTYMVTDFKENRISAMKEYMPLEIASRRPGSREVVPRKGSEEIYRRFCDSFLDEAQTIYNYSGHPNIINVYHLFKNENNTAYYVMEFINGVDLRKWLDQNGQRLSWEELKPIIAQIVSALARVHSSGVIHCDISPDNIFILDGGQAKLIDFGAAKNVVKSKSSVVLLKRGFAPPEQMSANGRLGPWTDIYALAVTIYRAYTGRMPPSAEERLESDRTLWPTQMGFPNPTPYWEQALRKAMALRVDDRYHSVMEFWSALTGEYTQPHDHTQPRGYTDGYSTGYPPAYTSRYQPMLECVRGIYAGNRINVSAELMLGTDRSRCNIPFPPGSPGISRVHLRLWAENGNIIAVDMGSTYGTWLGQQRMRPGVLYTLAPGTAFILGDNQIFRVMSPTTGNTQRAYR